jgi:c(7)-type cytochrome triheme protein
MINLIGRVARLCRLMCARSRTFRYSMPRWPRTGASTKSETAELSGSRTQRGKDTTELQAVKPHCQLVRLPIHSTAFVGVFAGIVFGTVLIVVLSTRASTPMTPVDLAPDENQSSQGSDYGKFQHSNPNHSRLPCLLCHRREGNAPRPTLPGASGHLPCAGCHAQQFANSDGPICSICHTDAKAGTLKSFPRLKSFRVKFDHAQHVRKGSSNCAACHRPARNGVALSIPAGFSAHTTCYGCHTPRAESGGRDISSCGTCHQLGGYSRTTVNARAFRVGFDHAKHKKVTCNECHSVRPGMPQKKQVTAPEPLNHHATGRGQSCRTCHDGKRAFGGDDFTACKRCHTGTTWHF